MKRDFRHLGDNGSCFHLDVILRAHNAVAVVREDAELRLAFGELAAVDGIRHGLGFGVQILCRIRRYSLSRDLDGTVDVGVLVLLVRVVLYRYFFRELGQ